MKNSKLLSCLKRLSAKERNLFKDYVHSPFFNKHEDTKKLLDLILTGLRKNQIPSRIKAFERIFPGEQVNESKINVIMSYLMNLLEAFMGQLIFDQNQASKSIHQLKASQQWGMTKIIPSQYNKTKQILQHVSTPDSQYFFHAAAADMLMDTHYILQGDRNKSNLLQQAVNHFDIYFLIERLRYSCNMLSRMNIINEAFNLGMLYPLLNYIETNKNKYLNIPALAIYYQILMSLLESENEFHYEQLIKALKIHGQSFSPSEAQEMYDYAQNYCIRKINAGKSQYQSAIFQLYNQQINQDLIKQNGTLLEWDYKNIVTVGCRLKAFDWTLNFIESNKSFLNDQCRANAYNYNLAAYHYAKQDYAEALVLLQKISLKDTYYHLGAKFIQTKIYFEQSEWNALYSLLDSFKIYLLRNREMATDQRKAPLNFIRFTQKLAKLKEKETLQSVSTRLPKVKAQLEQCKAIVNVDWLLMQLGELK